MPSPSAIVEAVLPQLLADDTATLDTQVALACIPAPTGMEERRAVWVAQRLGDLGLAVSRDAVGNVIARLGPPRGAPVVACAHLDTVFDVDTPLQPTHQGDRICCPGIGDNARGLAALLATAHLAARGLFTPARPLILAATVGEEGLGDLRGARHLFTETVPDACAAIAIDGPGDSRIVTDALGVVRLQVVMAGCGGHSWTADDAPNPLHALAHLAATLSTLPARQWAHTTVAVTGLHGGDAPNAIPTRAAIDVEVRTSEAGVLNQLVGRIEREAATALVRENDRRGPRHPPLTMSVRTTSRREAGATDPAHPLVTGCLAATAAIGRRAELAMASTDANAAMHLGIPAIALGAGGTGGDTHTTAEWYANADGALGIARVAATLLAATGLA